MQRIKINDKEYPCYPTMGAFARYKDITGKEFSGTNLTQTDILAYLYCLVKSACVREGIELPYADWQEFADQLLPEDFTAWSEEFINGAKPAAPAKKEAKKKK